MVSYGSHSTLQLNKFSLLKTSIRIVFVVLLAYCETLYCSLAFRLIKKQSNENWEKRKCNDSFSVRSKCKMFMPKMLKICSLRVRMESHLKQGQSHFFHLLLLLKSLLLNILLSWSGTFQSNSNVPVQK